MGRLYTPKLKNYQIKYQCPQCYYIDNKSLKHTPLTVLESETYTVDKTKLLESRKAMAVQHSTDWWNLYTEYLDSNEWKEKRAKILNRDKNTCQACGAAANVVHHLTYKRLFHEFDHDLVSLCSNCHDIIHKKYC